MGDAVRKPNHYQLREECNEVRDIIRERTTAMLEAGHNPDLVYDYTNAMKYSLRWFGKDGIQDVEKAIYCLQSMLEILKDDEARFQADVGGLSVPTDQSAQYIRIKSDADNNYRGC